MQVETFEIISADPSQGDNALLNELESPEALGIIERLGLTGQRSLMTEREGTGTPVRNPYRQMTVIEDRVYSSLLPKKVELSEYDEGPIPLRVLQVAAHGKDF